MLSVFPRMPKMKLNIAKITTLLKMARFSPVGDVQIAKSHTSQNGADKTENGSGCPKLGALVIVGDTEKRAANACDHVDCECLPLAKETF